MSPYVSFQHLYSFSFNRHIYLLVILPFLVLEINENGEEHPTYLQWNGNFHLF